MAAAGWRTRGQPVALAVLTRALERARLPQALLLVGPAQVGKTTLALDLAAGLLCLTSEAADRPCRRCLACRLVEHDSHPDLHRLAPSGAGDQIRLTRPDPGQPGEPGTVRTFLAGLALRPSQGVHRVAVIERADRLNEDAQNALLKVLEEPPEGAVICLAADHERPLLDTLRSRCTRLRLGLVDQGTIARLLIELELADPIEATVLARASAGRPGRAVALAGAPERLIVEARVVRQLLDLLAAPPAERLAAAPGLLADGAALGGPTIGLAAGELPIDRPTVDGDADDPEEAPRAGPTERRPTRRSPQERRRAVRNLLAAWAGLARDLAVAGLGGGAELRRIELLEELRAVAPQLSVGEVGAFLARLDGLDAAIEAYADPELVLDALLLAWPSLRRAA